MLSTSTRLESRDTERCRLLTVIHVPLALVLAVEWIRRSVDGLVGSDFSVFRTGWWLILNGQGRSLYEAEAQRAAQRIVLDGRSFEGGLMGFLNPPHAALAGLPLGWLADEAGGRVAFAVWTVVNVLLLIRLVRLIVAELGVVSGAPRWMVTVVILAFYPVLHTLAVGQVSLLLALGALEIFRSIRNGRSVPAAYWLLVLSIKPQLVPPVLLVLAVHRQWRTLVVAALMGAGAGVVTAGVLGGAIWTDYLRNVHGLEQFWGTGTPAYMMNIRGTLTRLFGSSAHSDSIYAWSLLAWLAAMVGLAGVLLHRRRQHGASGLQLDFALALAVALLFNPHLFPQDAVIWIVPLALFCGAIREHGMTWEPFAAITLSWPAAFAVSRVIDLGSGAGPALSMDPVVALMAVTLLVMTCYALAAASSRYLPMTRG